MTRSIIEEWGHLVKWPSKHDAHSGLRIADHRTLRPTGRGEYGYNRVQEIESGTSPPFNTVNVVMRFAVEERRWRLSVANNFEKNLNGRLDLQEQGDHRRSLSVRNSTIKR